MAKLTRITAPRKQILRLLADFCYLSTPDFYRLLPNGTTGKESHERAVRRILKDFTNVGYLNRAPIVDYGRSERFLYYRHIYWLSSNGLKLAQEEGLDNGQGKANDDHSPRTLDHEFEISKFHLQLADFAAEHSLELFWQQKELKRTVNPDALFALVTGEGAYYYFLEIEKSKLGKYIRGEPQILRKLFKYYEYYDTDACADEWEGFRKFRVIVVVRTEERRQNLLTHLSEHLKHRMFWIATERDYFNFLTPKDYKQRSYSFFPEGTPSSSSVSAKSVSGSLG